MADYEFILTGLTELIDTVTETKKLDDVKQAIKYHTANMARYALLNVPVDTGFLKRSEAIALMDAGMAGRVSFGADYGPYQEYGTRWIYGKFFLKKAYDRSSQEFIIDLERMFS